MEITLSVRVLYHLQQTEQWDAAFATENKYQNQKAREYTTSVDLVREKINKNITKEKKLRVLADASVLAQGCCYYTETNKGKMALMAAKRTMHKHKDLTVPSVEFAAVTLLLNHLTKQKNINKGQ
jgi:Pao retrotransposon peptidase